MRNISTAKNEESISKKIERVIRGIKDTHGSREQIKNSIL